MRNFGLDVVRSIAIMLVVVAHGMMFFLQPFTPVSHIYTFIAVLGVEIFFVLSGFLIGQILIKDVLTEKSWSSLRRFYIRRWFRTLPLYFLILSVVSITYGKFQWEHLFFVQNFNKESLAFFPVSWSLTVEEWFYLLIPLILLVLVRRNRFNTNFFKYITYIILFLVALRFVYIYLFNPTWDEEVRRQFFVRLDSLAIGVFLAGIKIYKRTLYEKLTRFPWILYSLSVVGFILLFKLISWDHIEKLNQSIFQRTFLLNIFSLLSGTMIIAFESDPFINKVINRPIKSFFTFLSLISYSLYLIHYEIYHYFSKYITSLTASLTIWMSSTALIIIIAFFLFKNFEQPVMNLRDKINWSIKRKSEKAVRVES